MPQAVSSWLATRSLLSASAGLLEEQSRSDRSLPTGQGQAAPEGGPHVRRWKRADLRAGIKERSSSSSLQNLVPCCFCQMRGGPPQPARQLLLHPSRRRGSRPPPELVKAVDEDTKNAFSRDLTRNLALLLGPGLLLFYAEAAWADSGGGAGADWAAALGEALYELGQNANALVQGQLQGGLTVTSGAVILGAGLVTSLSPCTLSVLPLTIGYIGGYDQGRSRAALVRDAAAFSLGLATTLAALGTGASLAGKAYGQIGAGLPIAASVTAMLMGLNLLEVLPLRFPSFLGNVDARELASGLPSSVQAYLAGLVFALAASPCSTPVLATLLTYVAAKQDPVVGSALLFTYTAGYVTPLLVAASFTGALKQLMALRKFSAWINPASGCLLLSGGLYTFLLRVAPAQ